MELIGSKTSHFARKVRLLLDHLELDYTFTMVDNVARDDEALFHGNPLMSVPTLIDGDVSLFESDDIAAYLVRTYAPADTFGVLTDDVEIINARSVMNNVMDNEVKLVLAMRTGLDPAPHAYFQKAEKTDPPRPFVA